MNKLMGVFCLLVVSLVFTGCRKSTPTGMSRQETGGIVLPPPIRAAEDKDALPPVQPEPPKAVWTSFDGVFLGGSQRNAETLQITQIAYFEGKPDNAIEIGRPKYLGTVNYILLNINGALLELPFQNIQSIEFGPNPKGVFGAGFATITMINGRKHTGTFENRAGGSIYILLTSESGNAKIHCSFSMEKGIIKRKS